MLLHSRGPSQQQPMLIHSLFMGSSGAYMKDLRAYTCETPLHKHIAKQMPLPNAQHARSSCNKSKHDLVSECASICESIASPVCLASPAFGAAALSLHPSQTPRTQGPLPLLSPATFLFASALSGCCCQTTDSAAALPETDTNIHFASIDISARCLGYHCAHLQNKVTCRPMLLKRSSSDYVNNLQKHRKTIWVIPLNVMSNQVLLFKQ